MQSLRVIMVSKDSACDYKCTVFSGILSILAALRKTTHLKEIWIVQEGGSPSISYQEDIENYSAFNFRDATEIIEKLKPNLILLAGDYEYLARSLLIAASKYKIPTVVVSTTTFFSASVEHTKTSQMFLGRFYLFRDHGLSILKRYIFLLRTLFYSNLRIGKIIKMIMMDCYTPLVAMEPRIKYGGRFAKFDLAIANNPETKDRLMKNGTDKERILITGDCSMDSVYQELSQLKLKATDHNKMNILFVTTAMVEHGYWTVAMRKEVVTKAVRIIREQVSNAELSFKIHPTSEKMEDYRNIVNVIDPSIKIIQNGDLLSLLNNADIIITFGQSTAILYALLLKKSVIILNLLGEDVADNLYLTEKVAKECKTIDELPIMLIESTQQNLTQNLDAFIKKTIYIFDGKCGERAARGILSCLN